MRVTVIGGGLAGLVAAWELNRKGATVTLLEAAGAPGGQIRTRRDAGFVVEDGAEGWVAADRDVPALCHAVGIEAQIVKQLERRSLLVTGGKVVDLTPGNAAAMLGIQASEQDLGGGIASLRDGMGSLAEALAGSLGAGAELRTGCAVTSLQPVRSGWRLTAETGYRGDCDAVILALPPRAAAALLEPVARESAVVLQEIVLHSNVSVSLAFQRREIEHALDASGLIVKPDEAGPEGFRACAFSTSKFPNRAPDGRVLLRAFFRPPALAASWEDSDWIESARRLLTPLLGISGNPLGSWVARLHAQQMQEVSERLRQHGRIELTGSAYHPGGVPGAVRSGNSAAKQLLDHK